MKSSNSLKIIIAGICSTLIAIGFGRFIYTPILPNMQNDLNLSSTIMGIISSYNYFGYLVGSIIPIIWKFRNFKNIIVVSSICSVITIYLMGFTTDLKTIIFFVCFQIFERLEIRYLSHILMSFVTHKLNVPDITEKSTKPVGKDF